MYDDDRDAELKRPSMVTMVVALILWIALVILIAMTWGIAQSRAQEQGGFDYFGPYHINPETAAKQPKPLKGEKHGQYVKRTGQRHPRPAEINHGRRP
jgi:predicted secreted Zn-dependent protease